MNVRSLPSIQQSLLRLGATALLGLLAGAAAAQPFEEVFGPRDARDFGEKRVTPIQRCAPEKGYITVGTHAPAFGPTMVYLIRTDINGVTLWEHVYDIGKDGRPDEGFALAELEDKTGFMITGTSNRGSFNAAFLLKVNCDGKPLFQNFYNPPSTTAPWRVVARDIVETRSGTPTLGTNRGDFLVAGYVDLQNGVSDGYMMRVRANGAVIWQRRYNNGVNERFFGLTEASPAGGSVGTGDAVAVGEYVNTVDSKGLAVRVNGNNGLIGAAPQCASTYGDAGLEALYSVIELKHENPNLAMVGVTDSPGLRPDVYLVKTRDNPCFLINQSFIGNQDGKAYTEAGYDLVEILEETDDSTGARIGDLAITGFAEQDGQRRDLTLLYADINFLLPITARVYGDHFDRAEEGRSIAQNYEKGFVMAGFSDTDWELSGDPRDLYLVSTTNSSKTGCEKEWFPKGDNPRWDPRQIQIAVANVVVAQPTDIDGKRLDTRFPVCH
jgi:hypothetical protein